MTIQISSSVGTTCTETSAMLAPPKSPNYGTGTPAEVNIEHTATLDSKYAPLRGKLKRVYILLLILFVVLLLGVLLLIFVKANTTSIDKTAEYKSWKLDSDSPEYHSNPYRWYEERKDACGTMDKCSSESKTLLVVSLDGFARKYLDTKIIKNAQYMQECGSSAEYVFPSYPSKTFPNHYTMVTGLYPGSHGIVDNTFYDPAFSSKLIDMKRATQPELYKGDPIWSLYKRKKGGRSACMMWIGCTYHPEKPDINVPFDGKIPDDEKVDTVVSWMSEPADRRPGLVLAYFNEPDETGHRASSSGPGVNITLHRLDTLLGRLLNGLHDASILDCTNIILLSDHGMSAVTNFINLRNHLSDPDLMISTGVVGRLYLRNSSMSETDVVRPYGCNNGSQYLLFNKDTLPTRYHNMHNRSGDVIFEGAPGSIFRTAKNYAKKEYLIINNIVTNDFIDREGDHGYDYLEEDMHTVFLARGPDIQRKRIIRPFQNVEYYNLFAELLGIPDTSPNNGTIGVLQDVLISPNTQMRDALYNDQPIENTTLVNMSSITVCQQLTPACEPQIEEFRDAGSRNPLAIDTSKHIQKGATSYRQIIGDSEILKAQYRNVEATVVTQFLNISTLMNVPADECTFTPNKYNRCPSFTKGNLSITSVAYKSFISMHVDTLFPVHHHFLKVFWQPLRDLTESYIHKFKHIRVISGAIRPVGVIMPSHFFRIIHRCKDEWNYENIDCLQAENAKILAFILPNVENYWNCMNDTHRLLKYTVRVKDIELLTGVNFFRNETLLSYGQSVKRKTEIVTRLW